MIDITVHCKQLIKHRSTVVRNFLRLNLLATHNINVTWMIAVSACVSIGWAFGFACLGWGISSITLLSTVVTRFTFVNLVNFGFGSVWP